MKLISTTIKNDNPKIEPFSIDSIFPSSGVLQDVIIVSAFTDAAFLKKIKNIFSRKQDQRTKNARTRRFAIYLDSAASKYFNQPSVKEMLDRLNSLIQNQFNPENSGVFLVQKGALFHSKFMMCKSANKYKIVLGSANMTSKAFSKNEELAISMEWNIKSNSPNENSLWNKLLTYTEKLGSPKDLVLPKDFSKLKTNDVRNRLLNGSLYCLTMEQNPFSYSLNLDNDYLSLLDSEQKKNNDFLLDLKSSNSITLESLINKGINGKIFSSIPSYFIHENRENQTWKYYAIETCYGFWVPTSYQESVEKSIRNRSIVKKEKLSDLKCFIAENSNSIKNLFVVFISKIRDDRRIKRASGEVLKSWKFDADNINIRKEAENWISNMQSKLSNDKYMDRLCRGVSYVNVPDVWGDDPIASQDFEDSVYESISYYLSSKSKIMKKICQEVKKRMESLKTTKTNILKTFGNCDFILK